MGALVYRAGVIPDDIHLGEQPASEDVSAGIGVGGHRDGLDTELALEFF